MTLQNRVTPFGEIVAVPARGLFAGNRGIIHDPQTKTLLKRRWTTKAWICCTLDWKGVRREPMARRSWTELFFLDEATAFAAGHRPCFYCRRERAIAFRDAWAKGKGIAHARAPDMDAVLHAERLDDRRRKKLHPLERPIADLPDGTMVAAGNDAHVVAGGRLWRWTFEGYRRAESSRVEAMITPPSIAAALSGFAPILHPSIGSS
jgi:hypothetical protein